MGKLQGSWLYKVFDYWLRRRYPESEDEGERLWRFFTDFYLLFLLTAEFLSIVVLAFVVYMRHSFVICWDASARSSFWFEAVQFPWIVQLLRFVQVFFFLLISAVVFKMCYYRQRVNRVIGGMILIISLLACCRGFLQQRMHFLQKLEILQ